MAKDRLSKRILEMQVKASEPDSWYGETEEMIKENNLDIQTNEIKNFSKSKWKRKIKQEIGKHLNDETQQQAKNKTKMRFMTEFKEKKYLTENGQKQAELLVNVKLNMIKARSNYGVKDICRLCKKEEETTEHLAVCSKVKEEKVTEEEIRSDSPECTRKVIKRFEAVKGMLEKLE